MFSFFEFVKLFIPLKQYLCTPLRKKRFMCGGPEGRRNIRGKNMLLKKAPWRRRNIRLKKGQGPHLWPGGSINMGGVNSWGPWTGKKHVFSPVLFFPLILLYP
jgi:hypothetical protein